MNPSTLSPYNQALETRRNVLAKAIRYALTPGCNPITGAPKLTPQQLRRQLLSVPIIAAVAGDNALIPTTSGRLLVYEVVVWNASAAARRKASSFDSVSWASPPSNVIRTFNSGKPSSPLPCTCASVTASSVSFWRYVEYFSIDAIPMVAFAALCFALGWHYRGKYDVDLRADKR